VSVIFENLPCNVCACASNAPPNLSCNHSRIAGIASAELIQAFHKFPSSFDDKFNFSLKISKIGNQRSAICNTSSVDNFHFAWICQSAVVTPFKTSVQPQTADTQFHKASNVGIACSAVKPNANNCFTES
jgi:hypothetical protein